jgi:15-cis-phytoene synthase
VLDALRQLDPERHFAVLFLPERHRAAVAAIHALRAELARIPLLVSEPLPGEIRLQWWKDVVERMRDGEAAAHPVASALLSAIDEHGLPVQTLTAMAEARIADLYQDPMPDVAALEAYLGETESQVFQLAAMILDRDAASGCSDASGHAGMALGVASLILRLPWMMRRSLCLLPGDMLAAVGTDARMVLDGDLAARDRALAAFCALGLDHLAKAQTAIRSLPASLRPAFVPLAMAARVFARSQRAGAGAFVQPIAPSRLAACWDMMCGAIRRSV